MIVAFRVESSSSFSRLKGWFRVIGALIIRIGFRGPFFYNYTKEPPKYYR